MKRFVLAAFVLSLGTVVHAQVQPGAASGAPVSLVTLPTLTKGTQGATGLAFQELKNAGRSRVIFTADRVAPAIAETLVTFVRNAAGTATAAQTTYTVTAGKVLHIQAIHVGIANTSAVSANVRVALRENIAGACTAASPVAVLLQVAAGAVAANEGANTSFSITDGLQFPAADSICISMIAAAITETATITVVGYEY